MIELEKEGRRHGFQFIDQSFKKELTITLFQKLFEEIIILWNMYAKGQVEGNKDQMQ